MGSLTDRIGLAAFGAAIVVGVAGYFITQPYFQALAAGLSSTALGLALAVLLVNKFLNSSEKQSAAAPLLQLISPNVRKLHNNLFLKLGRSKFGIDEFNTMIDTYQKNKRDPQAFKPAQRLELFEMIKTNRSELASTYEILQDQFRELSTIAGWSFDPRVVAMTLTARLNFATFKAIPWDETPPADATVLKAVESYLDADAACGHVFESLAQHIGMNKNEWTSDR